MATLIDRITLKWDGDDIDPESLDRQIDKVLTAKPYLVANGTNPAPPAPPRVPTGPRGKPAGTYTRADLQRMTPEEITAAFNRGELSHLTSTT